MRGNLNLNLRSAAAIALGLIGSAGLSSPDARAQCVLAKLMHADRQAGDSLGGSMSMSDGSGTPIVAVGMQGDATPAGLGAGSVRFFANVNEQWAEVPWLTITASDAQPNDYLGTSVSYRDPYLIVGAVGVGNTGAAYIYKRDGSAWVKEAKVIPPGTVTGDGVGRAVAIRGDWAIVGSPWADFDGSPTPGISDPTSGMATVYRRQADGTWTYSQTLRDANAGLTAGLAANARYGSAVDMAGFIAVIGVPYGQNVGMPAYHGYIRILRIDLATNAWLDDGTFHLTSPLVQAGDRYGAAVSTSGDAIAVGAPDDDADISELGPNGTAKSDSGAVYFLRYTVNGWQDDGKVIPPDATDNGHFGGIVSMGWGGSRCLISAYGAKKAYVYRRVSAGNWALEATIRDPDAASAFASGLAYDGTHAVIGDYADNTGGVSGGGALFAVNPSTQYGDSCEDAPVMSAANGSVSGCTTLAQADGRTTCGVSISGDGPDVWMSFVPTCTGPVTFSTAESGFDTVLSVHSDCPEDGDTHTMLCNDDANGTTRSQLTLNAVAGTRYLIRIGGYGGGSGFFNLMTWYPETPNDLCSSPVLVAGGNTYTFQNCSAGTDGPTAAGGPSPCADHMSHDVWYRFYSPVAGTLKLDTCGSNFDTMLAVYPGAVCPGEVIGEIACNDDAGPSGPCPSQHATSALSMPTLPVFPYTIRVGGFDQIAPTGDGVLHVNFIPACACDWNLSGALSVQDIFDFLASYFGGGGDFNQSGAASVQDIFDFLACYFGGCA